ncbi:hypothetical protein PG994_004380 [Apiospora phragmitis]|uniref:Uncharacterized protein n=1 Tax=Apiospora phragmitis TaxID=2905665 RepID=A0ABR1VQG1_9PEZI
MVVNYIPATPIVWEKVGVVEVEWIAGNVATSSKTAGNGRPVERAAGERVAKRSKVHAGNTTVCWRERLECANVEESLVGDRKWLWFMRSFGWIQVGMEIDFLFRVSFNPGPWRIQSSPMRFSNIPTPTKLAAGNDAPNSERTRRRRRCRRVFW